MNFNLFKLSSFVFETILNKILEIIEAEFQWKDTFPGKVFEILKTVAPGRDTSHADKQRKESGDIQMERTFFEKLKSLRKLPLLFLCIL